MATNQHTSESKSGTTNPKFQEFKVKGGQVVDKVREVIEEGNARRVIIRNGDRILLEFPLAVGVGGAAAALLLAPTLAAIGAIAALLTDLSVVVERDADGDGVADETTTLLGGKGAKSASESKGTGSASSSSTSSSSAAGGKTMGSDSK